LPRRARTPKQEVDDFGKRYGGSKTRKTRKVTNEDELDILQLQWKKDYAVFLKAADYSYGYISDAVGVTRSIVKHWFEDETMRKLVVLVQEDTTKGAIEFLKKASLELVELLLDIARSEEDSTVRLRAILEGLDRIGLAKVNKSESKVLTEDKQVVGFSPEAFEHLEGLPLETQQELAKMATEMQEMVDNSKGKE
jgi:hypothetical protein